MTLAKVYGEPPRFLVALRSNSKYVYQIQAVGQWIWVDIACWKTKHSALKGWSLEIANGFRLITPRLGFAFRLYLPTKETNA